MPACLDVVRRVVVASSLLVGLANSEVNFVAGAGGGKAAAGIVQQHFARA